jgi:hypothetical protein
VAFTITRIPERYRAGLIKMNALPLDTIAVISSTLEGSPPAGNLGELRSAIEKVPDVSSDDAEAITICLHSLYVLLAAQDGVSVDEFVTVLVDAMRASGSKALALTEIERAELTKKLRQLLSLKSLARTSKIEQLRRDQQAIFYDAKILTDIRPVFDNPEDAPVGAIIQHTLKLVFHESGEHRELYLAMAPDDVRILKEVSERADSKLSSLKALLAAANIQGF